jgi:hypothetical protein
MPRSIAVDRNHVVANCAESGLQRLAQTGAASSDQNRFIFHMLSNLCVVVNVVRLARFGAVLQWKHPILE